MAPRSGSAPEEFIPHCCVSPRSASLARHAWASSNFSSAGWHGWPQCRWAGFRPNPPRRAACESLHGRRGTSPRYGRSQHLATCEFWQCAPVRWIAEGAALLRPVAQKYRAFCNCASSRRCHFQHRMQQHVGASLNVVRRGILNFIVADAVGARNENHAGGRKARCIHRIVASP